MGYSKVLGVVLIGLISLTFSCKKTVFLTDKDKTLTFSTDTIRFDTVFSSQGSATRSYLVKNTHNKPIKIASISLQGTNAAYFQLNVDGTSGKVFSDVEIAAGDSIFVFAEVNVDPANRTNPLIIEANVVFDYNGNSKAVYLEAIGQDVIVFRPKKRFKFPAFNYSIIFDHPNEASDSKQVLGTDTVFTWSNLGKPYLIFDYLVIDSLQRLYIEQGCKVYFHNSSGLWAYRGATLKVRGTKANPVLFQGDRLTEEFKNEPGQWDRIWLNDGSDEHEIDYAIIKNGYIGIQTEPFALYEKNGTVLSKRKAVISNTIIQNCSGYGLYHRLFTVKGHNNVVLNCGEGLVNITLGGDYKYFHSTFANYYAKDDKRKNPSIVLSNRIENVAEDLDSAYFGNCIIVGKKDEEILADSGSGKKMDYVFENCLLRTKNSSITNHYHYQNNINVIFAGLELDNVSNSFNANLKSTSQAIQQGKISIAARFPKDLNGEQRFISSTVKSDIGAYQKK